MDRYSQFIIRYRYGVLLAALAVVVLIGSGTKNLVLSSDLEVFFAEDDPGLLAYDEIRNTYSHDDNIYLVLVPPPTADGKPGDIYTKESLAILEEVTDRAWSFPYATRVDSIANYQHTQAIGDDLLVRPLVKDAEDMSQADIELARRVSTTEPILLNRLITDDGDMAAINISIQFPEADRIPGIPKVVDTAWELRGEIESKYPGYELLITGKVAGNNSFTTAAVTDIKQIIPLALLIALICIAGYMYLASRSIATALAATGMTILVIIASVAVGMGMAGWLGFEVTPPVVNAPTVILTLAVADCIHILVTYFQARRRGKTKEEALTHSLHLNFRAVGLTSITTVIGFLALNFSDAEPFQDLGNIVAIGIVAAWGFSITLLPALIMMAPSKVKVDAAGAVNSMGQLAQRVISHPKLAFGLTTAAIILAASFVPQNELYDVWAEYFDEEMPIRQDSDRAREKLNGFNLIEYSLVAGTEAGSVSDPQYLQQLDEFGQWLKSQPEVTFVNSFVEIMKRLNRNMHGDDPEWHRVPESRELAAQYLLLYEFSLPFGLDLTNQVNLDKTATRLTAGLRSSSTKEIMALQERAQEWLRENAPEQFYHQGASSDVMFAHVGKNNVISMLYGSLLGLLAISIIIAIALKSIKFGFVSLLLNLLPMVVGFGLWGLMVGRVGMGLSVVSGLTMGIVVDYTVHLLSKYQMAQQENNLNTPDAIQYAFSTVGSALVVTTIVLCVNFGLLFFSVFVLNSDLGVLTAGIILIALVIDLFFLPPLLLWLDRNRDGTNEQTYRDWAVRQS